MGNGGIHDPSEQCNRLGDGRDELKALEPDCHIGSAKIAVGDIRSLTIRVEHHGFSSRSMRVYIFRNDAEGLHAYPEDLAGENLPVSLTGVGWTAAASSQIWESSFTRA